MPTTEPTSDDDHIVHHDVPATTSTTGFDHDDKLIYDDEHDHSRCYYDNYPYNDDIGAKLVHVHDDTP
jgi:hypothetical protein